MSGDAFFDVDGCDVRPTERIQGPWAPGQAHGGPPAALLGRYLEMRADAAERRIVRLHLELLRPVPIAPLRVVVDAHGGGRRVDRLRARLMDGEGRTVAVARAVRVAVTRGPEDGQVVHPVVAAPPPPDESPAPTRLGVRFRRGPDYFESMQLSIVSGSWDDRGAATAWLRPTVALVPGETWSPLQRVLVAADSSNGLSNVVDYSAVCPGRRVRRSRRISRALSGPTASRQAERRACTPAHHPWQRPGAHVMQRAAADWGRTGHCTSRGRPVVAEGAAMPSDRLDRPRRGEGRIIAGVCAGIADRFGWSRGLVRLLFVIFGFVGAGELAYIILWILMPVRPRRTSWRPRR